MILEVCSILQKQDIDLEMHFIGGLIDSFEIDKYPNLKDKVIFMDEWIYTMDTRFQCSVLLVCGS